MADLRKLRLETVCSHCSFFRLSSLIPKGGGGGIQYLSLTLAIVRPTPPWSVVTWARCTIFVASRAVSGRYTGYSPWIRPRHSSTPSSFGCRFSCSWSCSKLTLLNPCCWALLTKNVSCLFTSAVLSGPLALLVEFRELRKNLVTQAPILNALRKSNFSRTTSKSLLPSTPTAILLQELYYG